MLMDNSSFNGVESAPVMQPVVAPVKPKKQGGKILAIVIISIIFGALATSAVFVTLGAFKGDKKSNNGSSSTAAETQDGEIKDAKLIAELTYKTNRILGNNPSVEQTVLLNSYGQIAPYQNLSDKDKVMIVLAAKDYNNLREVPVSELPDSFEMKKSHFVRNGIDTASVIDVDEKLESDYQMLFGDSDPVWVNQTNGSTNGCPRFNYVPEKKYYVFSGQCGGVYPWAYYSSQYKYTREGDKAYVYLKPVSVYHAMAEGQLNTVYSGFGKEASKVGLPQETMDNIADGNDYLISQNISSFTKKYRAVYEKDSNGNYAYKTIEEVKE